MPKSNDKANGKQQEITTNPNFTIHINQDNSRIAEYPDAEEKLRLFSVRHVRSLEDQCLFYILQGLKLDMQKNEAGPF